MDAVVDYGMLQVGAETQLSVDQLNNLGIRTEITCINSQVGASTKKKVFSSSNILFTMNGLFPLIFWVKLVLILVFNLISET